MGTCGESIDKLNVTFFDYSSSYGDHVSLGVMVRIILLILLISVIILLVDQFFYET